MAKIKKIKSLNRTTGQNWTGEKKVATKARIPDTPSSKRKKLEGPSVDSSAPTWKDNGETVDFFGHKEALEINGTIDSKRGASSKWTPKKESQVSSVNPQKADWGGLGSGFASNFKGNGGFTGLVAPAVQGAMIGGVGGGLYESATGGSFWEGAKTGAFYGGTFGAGRAGLRGGVGAKAGQGTWDATGQMAKKHGVGVKSLMDLRQNVGVNKASNGLK